MSLLLRVEDLKTQFTTERGLVRAVDGGSYDIEEGEIIGLVGESGCGKSVSQLSIMRLIPSPPGEIVGGRVMFEGQDLLGFEANSAEMRAIRGGKIAMIFQEPMTSLNPALTIARQLTEVMQLHLKHGWRRGEGAQRRVARSRGDADGERRIDDYPHQFSGGMRQRVMVAMAVSCNPTSSHNRRRADHGPGCHDPGAASGAHEGHSGPLQHVHGHGHPQSRNRGPLCPPHQCHVCRAHRGVGYGEGDMDNPLHPYTIGLLQCVPKLGSRLTPIRGFPPHLINMGLTCPFLPRCGFRKDSCETDAWSPLRHVEGAPLCRVSR